MAGRENTEPDGLEGMGEDAAEASEDRVPLAGFEELFEITRSGLVYDKKLGSYIKDTFNPFSRSAFLCIHVDGKKHDLSHWEAVFNSFLSEADKREFEELVSKIPPFVFEDKHNLKYKSPRYLLPYVNKFDLPLYIFQSYLKSKKVNIKPIAIEDERKFRYIELGCDDLRYILNYDCGKFRQTFSTSTVAEMLGLGTIRKVNALLLEWGLQKKENGGYAGLMDSNHWNCIGRYNKLVWYFTGIKIIYDTAVDKGCIKGNDAAFVDIIKRETDIFEF